MPMDTFRTFCPSPVYIMYKVLSIFWELVDLYLDGECGAVPPGTVEAVLRFKQNNFLKLQNCLSNSVNTFMTTTPNININIHLSKTSFVITMVFIFNFLLFLKKLYSSSWYYATMGIKSGTLWWIDPFQPIWDMEV